MRIVEGFAVDNKNVVILQRWNRIFHVFWFWVVLGLFLDENGVDKFMECKIPVVQIYEQPGKSIFNCCTGATCKGQFLDL